MKAAGFDLVGELQVGWYNATVPEEWRLPDFGRASSRALVIGATRALWPAFLAHARLDAANPLEEYARAAIAPAVAALGVAHELRFAADRPPRGVAIQRAAEAAGLAFVSPARLAVHPVFGPWISLHAVAVLDEPGPAGPPPPRPPGLCAGCAARCVPLLDAAVARAGATLAADPDRALAEGWRDWLAVRDACPHGREHRYDDAQILYGYTKDRALLR